MTPHVASRELCTVRTYLPTAAVHVQEVCICGENPRKQIKRLQNSPSVSGGIFICTCWSVLNIGFGNLRWFEIWGSYLHDQDLAIKL